MNVGPRNMFFGTNNYTIMTMMISVVVGGNRPLAFGSNIVRINSTPVLSATSLGTSVTTSSLTGVGTLATLDVSGNVNFTGTTATFTASGPVVLTNTSVAGNVAAVETTGLTAENIMVNPGDEAGNAEILFGRGSARTRIFKDQAGNFNLTNVDNTGMFFGTNNSTRMTIGNSGSVGIGTTVTPQKLTVAGNMDLAYSTNSYRIQNQVVLSPNTLGPGVKSSSLTTVGTLSSLTVNGDVTIDSSTLRVDSAATAWGL